MRARTSKGKSPLFQNRGRLVRSLVDHFESEGHSEVAWDGRDNDGRSLPSGVYLYRLAIPGRELTRKMLLLK